MKILEVDEEKRRISLGLKQAQSNPWTDFAEKHPVGSTVEGEVKNATEFGLFIGLDGDVDGMVHMSDIAWGVSGEEALALHRKGETVKAVVLDVDVEKERISLGMKQLERGGVAVGGGASAGGVNKGETVTVSVLEVRDGGLEVQVGDDGATGFIKRTDLGRDRDEQRPERFQVGQKFDAQVIGFDRSKKPNFSIKALQIAEEKQAVAQYGSSDSGASLGDILGAALKEKEAAKAEEEVTQGKPLMRAGTILSRRDTKMEGRGCSDASAPFSFGEQADTQSANAGGRRHENSILRGDLNDPFRAGAKAVQRFSRPQPARG